MTKMAIGSSAPSGAREFWIPWASCRSTSALSWSVLSVVTEIAVKPAESVVAVPEDVDIEPDEAEMEDDIPSDRSVTGCQDDVDEKSDGGGS